MGLSDKNLVSLAAAEHIGPVETGDNIDAKRSALYTWNGTTWERAASEFLMGPSYDYTGFSNPDGSGNYRTIEFKTGGSSGTVVRTLTLTYDGFNNVTSIAKT